MYVDLICPVCRVTLDDREDSYACNGCGRIFPVVAGIPDLRLRSDRYLTLEEDRLKATALAARRDLDFPDLLHAYWAMTPEVPVGLAEHYVAAALDGRRRGEAYLDAAGIDCEGRSFLDIGCGTGGALEAAALRRADAVGIDIALRWLVVADRRLKEAGVEVPLVAADGALLPFPARSFDVTVALETLEHAHDQRGLIHSGLASVRPGGMCRMVVANRFSLVIEPTSKLWGVGFLPRRAAAGYVMWRKGTRYQHFRAISVGELRAMLGPRSPVRLAPAPLPPPSGGASRTELAGRRIYELVRRSRLGQRLLTSIGPYLELIG